jgi:hypothetical protein
LEENHVSATQLYYTLLWPKDAPPLVDHLLRVHLLTLEGYIEEALWFARHDDVESYTKFVDAIGRPTPEEQSQFLLAPSAFPLLVSLIGYSPSERSRAVLQAFKDDIMRRRNGVAADMGWTRLTDFKVDDRGDRSYNEVLGDSIIVDFESEECLRVELASSVFCRAPVPFTDDERTIVLEKLRSALKLIDDTASTAGRLIRNATRCIRVRKSTAEVTAAETDPQVIGEMRLHNPHLDKLQAVDIADALIHESLHNFLAMYEYRYGGFVDYRQTAQVRPVSPWTGNPIPYNAFTHAVIIYFALFNFYRLLYPKLATEAERRTVSELMTRCSRGFRVVDLSECLSVVGSSPDWLHAMYQKMAAEVRRHYLQSNHILLAAA